MLQLILITTNTGVPKFKKSLITDLDRDIFLRLSNLIVTLHVKSKREVDHKLSYFELNNRGVTIEENTQTKLLCILMHDISDGYEFAKLVAEELLDRFISTFKTPSSVSTKTLYSNSFKNQAVIPPPSSSSNNNNTTSNNSTTSEKKNSPQSANGNNNNNNNHSLFGMNNHHSMSSDPFNDLAQEYSTTTTMDNNFHSGTFSGMNMNLEQLSVDDFDQNSAIEFDFNNVNVDEKIFEAKLAEIYLELVYPIIEHLDSVRGILNSWVIESGDEGILTTTKPQLEADLKFLVNNCDRLLNGEMQNLSIKGNGKNLQIVIVEHKCHLVVLLESNVQPEITSFAIEKAVFLLRKVYALRKNIKIQ